MKLWIDDVRPAPEGYIWLKSVNDAMKFIYETELKLITAFKTGWNHKKYRIELIDIDHDAGDFAKYGGDYIKLLDWLEETGRDYPIHIHSQNSVGVQNMRRIIERNGWKELR